MHTPKEIQEWLISQIAAVLHISPEDIDIRESFANYGLSSRDAVILSGDLEAWLNRRLSPTLAYDHPNILSLSEYLGGDADSRSSTPPPASPSAHAHEPIAVIGLGCRFPGAKDPEAYWQILKEGGDMISEIPADRWRKEAFFDPDPSVPGKAISRWGGFLDRIDQFDPFFFGISPMEARIMDPQQRLLLELSHEALDDAGQVIEDLSGSRTGVFVGISVNEYSHLQFRDPAEITSHSGTGSTLAIAANRISYFYNFRGPSMAIDSACSSSLTAVHLACESIKRGECELALAGGVNLILSPAHAIAFTKAGLLAPDGRCKTFDARADGYVRGEGGGLVVLKNLSRALEDGDPVQAVILGSAMSQDGRSNGLMAPSREAQQAMLRDAYAAAGISPGSVQYVEAHGTGTLLGDSIEAEALGAVVGKERDGTPCRIGSVKSNIGHLESAAGIAGLIKVIVSLKNQRIPPSLHYEKPNPHIPFQALKLKVQNKLEAWPETDGPALAGISSFGFGGTLVHMVVQEGIPPREPEPAERTIPGESFLLPLSAGHEDTLHWLVRHFLDLLDAGTAFNIRDICRAAGLRRSHYDLRLLAIGRSRKDLITGLKSFLRREPHPDLYLGGMEPGQRRKLVFVFPGQGGQWAGMARELFRQEPVFTHAMNRIDMEIRLRYGWSLIEELHAAPSETRIGEIDVIQPALFAIQVALAELWRSWGIVPDALVGHSMGEVAAAHTAGILSLEDALKVICGRSLLLRKCRGQGSMLVTELAPGQARQILKDHPPDISIAAVNSPSSTVLSGSPESLAAVMEDLQRQNLYAGWVNVDVASHSPQMEPLREDLQKALKDIGPQEARIPVYSTVTGARAGDGAFKASYWMDNLRKPVLFADTIGQMLEDGFNTFIEIGPHPILLGSIQQCLPIPDPEVSLLPSLRRDEPEREALLRSLGKLYTLGVDVNWKHLYPGPGKYIHLPSLPWHHQRFWIEGKATSSTDPWHQADAGSDAPHPLLGERISLANAPSSFIWQAEVDPASLRFLEEHRIGEEIVFPASAYIEMAWQAARTAGLEEGSELADLKFETKMVLAKGASLSVQSHLTPEDNTHSFRIYSQEKGNKGWTQHASARFIPSEADNRLSPYDTGSSDLMDQESERISGETFYEALSQRGVHYGPIFRAIEYVWRKENEALGRLRLPVPIRNQTGHYQLHPALLDACLQVLGGLKYASREEGHFLPTACDRVRFAFREERPAYSHVSLLTEKDAGGDSIRADVRIMDENFAPLAELSGLRLQRAGVPNRSAFSRDDTWMYQVRWQSRPMEAVARPVDKGGKNWLILADEQGFADSLAKLLEMAGDRCRLLHHTEVMPGLEAKKNTFQQAVSGPLDGIIHLWSLDILPEREENGRKSAWLGCNSILLLVQALSQSMAGMPRLWLLTRGAQPVSPGEAVAMEQSPIWGLGKVIGFELPELKCVRVDLDPRQSVADAAPLVQRQLLEKDREDQIAFRGGDRFVQRLLPFSARGTCASGPLALRKDGTYLITGGRGGLGLATAGWMARHGAAHLVLLGRSEADASTREEIERWRRKGVEIVLARADVSDKAQLRKVFAHMEENLPPLRGVIHAAGVLDDGSLLNLDPSRMKTVMDPKVEGTRNLHRATAGLPLDFFVLYSSATSVLGSPGQGNYAAASSYLDAVAHHRQHLGLPALSINWGPWAEVGLAAEATERLKEQNASTQHLVKVIGIEQGLAILEYLLTTSAPQVMALPFDLKNLIELYPQAAGLPFLAEVGGDELHVGRLYARPNLRQKYVAPRTRIERKLAELWEQTLHIDKVGIHDSFFELGGDSVLGAQILSSAQKTFGIRINPEDAFKAFTIERLAERLESEILSRVEDMSEEDARRLLSNTNLYEE